MFYNDKSFDFPKFSIWINEDLEGFNIVSTQNEFKLIWKEKK